MSQWVERWTPCGGGTRPGYKRLGFEALRALDVYEASEEHSFGWWQNVASQSQ